MRFPMATTAIPPMLPSSPEPNKAYGPIGGLRRYAGRVLLTSSSTVPSASAPGKVDPYGLAIAVPPKLMNTFDAGRDHIRCLG